MVKTHVTLNGKTTTVSEKSHITVTKIVLNSTELKALSIDYLNDMFYGENDKIHGTTYKAHTCQNKGESCSLCLFPEFIPLIGKCALCKDTDGNLVAPGLFGNP